MSVILVIEDDRKINQLLCSILQQGGMETRSAFDGMEGWEMAVKNEYSLILMDSVIPPRSDRQTQSFDKQRRNFHAFDLLYFL